MPYYYGVKEPNTQVARYWVKMLSFNLAMAKSCARFMKKEYDPLPGENRVIGFRCPDDHIIKIDSEYIDGVWHDKFLPHQTQNE